MNIEGMTPAQYGEALILMGDEREPEKYVNSDHILSIGFDGTLYTLLSDGVYERTLSQLSEEGRKYIIQRENLLEEYMWECSVVDDNGLPVKNSDDTEFDSYDEYMEFEGEA